MTTRRNLPDPFDDIEKPRLTVSDGFGDRIPAQPLAVRLGDLWNDFLRVPPESDTPAASRAASAVPLLDDMKGILQWD
jgi:hypothetical protein